MMPIILLSFLYLAQILSAPKKSERYRNIDTVFTAFILCIAELVIDLAFSLFPGIATNQQMLFYPLIVLQAIILFSVRLISKKKDSYTKYGIPLKYTIGKRADFISRFYDTKSRSPVMYSKGATSFVGLILYLCAVILLCSFITQSLLFQTAGNTVLLPYAGGGLISFLIEFALFCSGESLWKRLLNQYNRRKGCNNRRDLAGARYAAIDDFRFSFMKNHVWEYSYITRATKLRWKKRDKNNPIIYYNFSDRSKNLYQTREFNSELESFLQQNQIEPKEQYITAYNLIERNENVLIKTPSYVDFEPYLTALLKMKVAKTQKIVLVVSNEEKKAMTIKKLHNAFTEYFGFESIPVINTIEDCVILKRTKKTEEEERQAAKRNLSHFRELFDSQPDIEPTIPIKESDIIVAAPEDICDPAYVETIREVIKHLGLIIYYDFSDCVQEEALFSRIVHSVLDYKDEVSTLYMSDGFFDLEQVFDNFFSKRNMYQITVPRDPSEESYVMGWKAEHISEMQTRTVPDASRNIGNHIPILFDSARIENDFMVIEDEYDAYAENYANFSQNDLASRLDCHVGWSDVLGGNSVFCTVSDTYNNVAHTYLAMRGIGKVNEYINIISRPYLLRNYLMYHLRYFAEFPDVLSSYSPGVIKSSRALAYEAIVKAYVAGCTIEQLQKYVSETSVSTTDDTPEKMLCALANAAYGEPLEGVKVFNDIYDRYYVDDDTYCKIIDRSGFVEKIEFVNNNKVIRRNKREYSCLIPQQKIVLNGIKYTVEAIKGNRVELTDANLREPMFITRAVRTCQIDVKNCEGHESLVQQGGGTFFGFRRFFCDVDLSVYGNIIFKDSYHPFCENSNCDYQPIHETQQKHYNGVNVFSINLRSAMIHAENRAELAQLMAMILNEMLPTFFPRCSDRIIIGCNDWNIESDFGAQIITPKYIVAQMNINDPEPVSENEIRLYILEDSPLETGLVNVFWQDEEVRYMLSILEDYLYYQEMIRREENSEIFGNQYYSKLHTLRKILLQVINEKVDINEDGSDVVFTNKIRTSRNKFNRLDLCNCFHITCDFCGKPISAHSDNPTRYHFYAYSGMVSCLDCFSKAVCSEKHSQSAVAHFQAEINQWFAKKYKETVSNLFYNYFEDVELLATEGGYRRKFIVTDDWDSGEVSGISWTTDAPWRDIFSTNNADEIPVTSSDRAADDKNLLHREDVERSGYVVTEQGISSILIRDGLALKKYMGVLCHEMVHQWQGTNLIWSKTQEGAPGDVLDEFGMSVDLSTFRIEGHAEWERIRYLKRHGSYFRALKEASALKNTNDPYGVGYRWMCYMMKVGHDDLSIHVDRTPGFIAKRNKYQFLKNSFALMRLYFGQEPPEDETT